MCYVYTLPLTITHARTRTHRYFSSLNMLKQMREINSDTTSAAIASSADAASAAAAAAAAANIPAIKHLKLGADDVMDAALKKQQVCQIK